MDTRLCTSLIMFFSFGSTSCQITLIPDTPRVPRLLIFTFLQCEIEPMGVSGDLEPGWRLPSGDFLTRFNDSTDMKLSNIALSVGADSTSDVFILTLQKLSYQLAGTYSCELRDPTAPGEPTIVTEQVELQLNVALRTGLDRVLVLNDTESEESEVELSCEMTLYAREDEDLQWFREGQLITSGSDRHRVTYRDGEIGMAQRGGSLFIPGRVAVLTISDPESRDSGTYTCEIAGTDESINFHVIVIQNTNEENGGGSEFLLPTVFGSIIGVLGLVVILLFAVICILLLRKRNILYGSAPSQANVEMNGHSDPLYGIPEQAPEPTYVNALSRAELEKEGYNHPRYKVEQTCSSDPHIAADRDVHAILINTPSRAELERDGYSDPRYYHEKGSNIPSPPATINPRAVSEQAPESTYVNTPSRDELEKDGYSDPRYYGDH